MFIGLGTNKTDGKTILIGLTDANVERLKQDKPIVFSLQKIGLSNGLVCVSWKNEDGFACVPVGFEGLAFAFDDCEFEKMKTKIKRTREGEYTYAFFRAATDEAIESLVQGGIGPRTIVRHIGRHPSAIPPSRN